MKLNVQKLYNLITTTKKTQNPKICKLRKRQKI